MSGQHAKHWHCAIYEQDKNAPIIPIPDEMWKTYYEDSEMTRGLSTRKLREEGDPLFYLLGQNGSLVFFGPTMMFRLTYPNTPLGLVPQKLCQKSEIDLAEAIFGYVPNEKHDNARAGRLFFTDACLESNQTDVWLPLITPKILSSAGQGKRS